MKINFNKKYFIIIALVLVLLLGSVYAYFNYYKQSGNKQLIAGDIYLNMDESGGVLNLTNIFQKLLKKHEQEMIIL